MPGRVGSLAGTLACMTGWRRHAWWGVWFIGVAFGGAQRGSWQAVVALVVGALVGAAWQAAARRDVADRLTWLAGVALVFGFAFLLDAAIATGSSGPEVGLTVYFVAVAAAVVVTEQVLRRRDRGPVTLDMVHAPDEVDGADVHHGDVGRRAEA